MKIEDVRTKAFAMPLNDPVYPRPPYRLQSRVHSHHLPHRPADTPRPRARAAPSSGRHQAYEFIRMPDSTGFGDYTETGQVIPVRFRTPRGEVQEGGYVHAMYL